MSRPPESSPLPPAARLVFALALWLLLPGMLVQLGLRLDLVGAEPAAQQLAVSVAMALAGVAVLAFAVLLPPAVAWRPVRAAAVLRAYVVFALPWLVLLVLYLRLLAAAGAPAPPQPLLQQLAEHGTALPHFWLVVGAAVLLAPLVEEVLFRGYLLGTLLQAMRPWPAQLLTAAAFGLVHGPYYALPIGCLSLLFGWLRCRYRALLPSVLAHGVHNGLTIAVTVAWPGHLQWLYPR